MTYLTAPCRVQFLTDYYVAGAGCAEPLLEDDGVLQGERLAGGAVYRLRCDPRSGARLVGSSTLVCDGHSYNDTTPLCVRGPTRLQVSGPDTLQVGREVTFTCRSDEVSQPARLQWSLTDTTGGRLEGAVITSEDSRVLQAGSGLVSQSSLSLTVSPARPVRNSVVVVECLSISQDYTVSDDLRVDIHCKYYQQQRPE